MFFVLVHLDWKRIFFPALLMMLKHLRLTVKAAAWFVSTTPQSSSWRRSAMSSPWSAYGGKRTLESMVRHSQTTIWMMFCHVFSPYNLLHLLMLRRKARPRARRIIWLLLLIDSIIYSSLNESKLFMSHFWGNQYFWSSLGSTENWFEPKTKLPKPLFTY